MNLEKLIVLSLCVDALTEGHQNSDSKLIFVGKVSECVPN